MESANMNPHLDKLSEMLNLSPYQKNTLAAGAGKYDMSRLVKRGGLLYAPYDAGGLSGIAADLLRGRRADLIGRNKTLLRNMRGIRFYSAGFHSVRVGGFMYYADASGAAISRAAFMRGIQNAAAR